MINASIVMFIGYLSHEIKGIHTVLEDAIDSFTGEIFYHSWMARVTDLLCAGELSSSEKFTLLSEANRQLHYGSESLSNLIAVSFVEHLPPPQENGYELIEEYPFLLIEYKKIFGIQT